MQDDWKILSHEVHHCCQCERLRAYCHEIAQKKKKAFLEETYAGYPVNGFGDIDAELICVGLAPSAHGANRTGRPFTGDASGVWLYKALYEAGYANQPHSVGLGDGLILSNAYITCTVKCAPPENHPDRVEIAHCVPFLKKELLLLKHKKVIVALGKLACDAILKLYGQKMVFGHLQSMRLESTLYLLSSYHPSPQNTCTKKLTWPMWVQVFDQAKKLQLL